MNTTDCAEIEPCSHLIQDQDWPQVPMGPIVLTSGLMRPFLTPIVVPFLEPSSKAVFPVAWITGIASDPRRPRYLCKCRFKIQNSYHPCKCLQLTSRKICTVCNDN